MTSEFTRIDAEESCTSRVAEDISKNEGSTLRVMVYQIGNNRSRFESAFALHDGHFTVQHIIDVI
jgi:hypothetical protein